MEIGEGDSLSELLLAVERYRSRPPIELSGAQIGKELVQLRHVIDLVELEFARLSGRFAETSEWDDGGFFSPIHWFRATSPPPARPAAPPLPVVDPLSHSPL